MIFTKFFCIFDDCSKRIWSKICQSLFFTKTTCMYQEQSSECWILHGVLKVQKLLSPPKLPLSHMTPPIVPSKLYCPSLQKISWRCNIWSLSDSNQTQPSVCWVCLQIKWLWVWVLLLSLKLQIFHLFQVRSFLTFSQL